LKDDNDGDEVDIVTGEKVGVNREIEELLDALYACCELEKKRTIFLSIVYFRFFSFSFSALVTSKDNCKVKNIIIFCHFDSSFKFIIFEKKNVIFS
jgi:hypothetical protein